MSALGPPAPPTREGDVMTISRVTRDGRRLHYDLQVLQQPERARACGSGPKCETKQYPSTSQRVHHRLTGNHSLCRSPTG